MTGKKNSNPTDLALAAFREIVTPLAQSPTAGRLDFTRTPKDGSYFKRPSHATLSREEMEAMGHSGELTALEALWRARGLEALLPLIPRLVAIAELIASEQRSMEAAPEAPSQLIYQMH